MLILLTKAMPSLEALASPDLGRLLTPRHVNGVDRLVASGIPWAADNDAFQGFKVEPYFAMLSRIANKPNCLFVCAPDVVGDVETSLLYFDYWEAALRQLGLPPALVAQDGLTPALVPWDRLDALFIGGSTEWKLGPEARRLVDAAKDRGKWVHMGRVNSVRRLRYARSIEVDSVDGSGWSRFSDAMLPGALRELASGTQLGLAE